MDLAHKRVLVTGAEGFIGSHLCQSLIKAGCQVRAFTLYNSFNYWGWLDHIPHDILDGLEVFPGDIRDPHRVHEAATDCDVVIHLAALVAIPYSYRSPDAYIDTNVKGTLNVLQAAKQLGIEKVVHTSSSEVYGTARYIPIDEGHPLRGQSPYSASKIAADQMASAFYFSYDTPVAIVRPFNTYGPRQSARAVIPTAITQILAGQRRLKLGSTHPTRDFNYIKDSIKGILAVTQSDRAIGEIINIGSGYEISIGKLVELIAEIMEVEVDIVTQQERQRPIKSEVLRLCADNACARRLTGWKPEYAGYEGLKRGLTETIGWFSHPNNLSKYRTDIYNI